MLKSIVVALALMAFGTPAAAGNVGPQFQVNTYKSNHQGRHAVAALKGGGFLVTWQSYGQDGSRLGIYAQRFGALGNPLGPEFKVNTQWRANQFNPAVAALAGGGFVITWQSESSTGFASGVYGQSYNFFGKPIGGEVYIGPSPAYVGPSPAGDIRSATAVTGLPDGSFVVVWKTSNDDIIPESFVVARQLRPGITRPTTRLLIVGEYHLGLTNYSSPKVVGLVDGGFVVVWVSENGHPTGLFARRYSSLGSPVGAVMKVAGILRASPRIDDLNVVTLNDGGFLVTWTHDDPRIGRHVLGQRFTPNAALDGNRFRISTINGSSRPSVAPLPDNGFVAVYRVEQDMIDGIYGQRYNASGGRAGSEFTVLTSSSINDYRPAVAGLKDGGLVAIWSAPEGIFQDGDGVFGQLFTP
jgi:hypothetical protein